MLRKKKEYSRYFREHLLPLVQTLSPYWCVSYSGNIGLDWIATGMGGTAQWRHGAFASHRERPGFDLRGWAVLLFAKAELEGTMAVVTPL